MAVKRRIVWFSDEDWTILQSVAKERGDSVSAVLRDLSIGPAYGMSSFAPVNALAPLGTAIAQAERDAILGKINRGTKP